MVAEIRMVAFEGGEIRPLDMQIRRRVETEYGFLDFGRMNRQRIRHCSAWAGLIALKIIRIILLPIAGLWAFAVPVLSDGCSYGVLEGRWQSVLEVGSARLPLVLTVRNICRDDPLITVDSPSQGAYGIAGNPVHSEKQPTLFFPSIGAYLFIQSVTTEAQDTLSGRWLQGGLSTPLQWTPNPEEKKDAEPSANVGTIERINRLPLTVKSSDGVLLEGEITLPAGYDRVQTGVVLISGTGPQDLDGRMFEYTPFKSLASAFARQGIATVRFNDRGVNGSEGDYWHTHLEQLADDVLSAKSRLLDHADRIFFVGHSEGGLVGALAANKDQAPDLAGLVLLATPPFDYETTLVTQVKNILASANSNEHQIDEAVAAQREAVDIIRKISDADQRETEITKLLIDKGGKSPSAAQLEARVAASEGFRSRIESDPPEIFRTLKKPTLIILGLEDRQIPVSDSMGFYSDLIGSDPSKDGWTLCSFGGLNHFLKSSPTHASKVEDIDGDVVRVVLGWIMEETVC
ncbi:alpha/beta hydrolase family protein [Eilatimonas milleporae]|uniref:Serine aminopeptidase S33 domain-containing protein n=1 Tax=Eilatimonas milleporae TaxID=911205 RepID=A0A3M0BWJ8_9PROT|nr:alpha/beta fold hydrolase [Eilatimonas milleporae]RMB01798.1 hypothetical protein BXY39_3305 [Eilatimonas milleporae]